MAVQQTSKTNRDGNEAYRSRLDAERVRNTEMRARDEALRARDEALRALQAVRAENKALAKRLCEMEAQLRALGVEPKLS